MCVCLCVCVSVLLLLLFVCCSFLFCFLFSVFVFHLVSAAGSCIALKDLKNSETRMTASALKQDPNT